MAEVTLELVRALAEAGEPQPRTAAYRQLLAAAGTPAEARPPYAGLDLRGLDTEVLGAVHQHVLARTDPTGRRSRGAFYTPPWLVAQVLDLALQPLLDDAARSDDPATALLGLTVLDPACGTGVFLAAAADRITARLAQVRGAAACPQLWAEVAGRCLVGRDLDEDAVLLARAALWLQAGAPAAVPPELLAPGVRAGDGLTEDLPAPSCIVGNPPFLSQLSRLTADDARRRRAVSTATGGARGAYTDTSAAFLARAARLVAPGGRVALVQPASLLGARHAEPVRTSVAAAGALVALRTYTGRVFDAAVEVCVPVVQAGAVQGPVAHVHHPGATGLAPGAGREVPPPAGLTSSRLRAGAWSPLLAAALGVPAVQLPSGTGTLADLGRCLADFRDQYYALRGHVLDGTDGPPLLTTGLVDPACTWWGHRAARFDRRAWAAPRVQLAGLAEDHPVRRWAAQRLVPKVVVSPQGRLVEAVVDVEGRWLPAVPLLTVVADPEQLWRVAAVLLAPPVAAHLISQSAGTGLGAASVRLAARQLAALPLPVDDDAWAAGARAVRRAHEAVDAAPRRAELLAAGRVMCKAYGVGAEPLLSWWAARLAGPAAAPAG